MISQLVEENFQDFQRAWPNGPWDLIAITPSDRHVDSRIFQLSEEKLAKGWMARHYRRGNSILCALPGVSKNGG